MTETDTVTAGNNILSQLNVGAMVRFKAGSTFITTISFVGQTNFRYLTLLPNGSQGVSIFLLTAYSYNGSDTAKAVLQLYQEPGQFWGCTQTPQLGTAVIVQNTQATIMLRVPGGSGSLVHLGAEFSSPQCTGDIGPSTAGSITYLDYCKTTPIGVYGVDIVG